MLDGGSRGGMFEIRGVLVGSDEPSVLAEEQLLLSYCDGVARPFTDTDGNLYTSVAMLPEGYSRTTGGIAFAGGWLVSWLLNATSAQRISLIFGLGMNNNGTGLVVASMALADHPRVMLPIISYNLIQHIIAGIVDRLNHRISTPPRLSTDTDFRGGHLDRVFEAQRILVMEPNQA